MGPGIASTIALGGVPVTILGRTADSARQGLSMARKAILSLEENGLTPTARANWALEHLDESTEFEKAFATCDLVIESTPEDMAFKQDLFRRMDAIVKPDAVLASNTSGLSITAIASAVNRPERVLTTHFWNPPHLMPLVEIVRGEKTDPAVAIRLRDFLRSCGKVPVLVKKDRPGQLGNRLQMALVREAMFIVQEGIADVADVDLAARTGFGLRLPAYGIFEHADNVGLPMVGSIVDYVSKDLCNQTGVPGILREKIEAGASFYDWKARDIGAMRARRDAFLLDFLKRYTPGW